MQKNASKLENKRLEAREKYAETFKCINDKDALKTEIEVIVYDRIASAERVSMRELAYEFGLSTREVRKVIENIRRKGVRIGSDNKGYYLCESDLDFQEFVRSYTASARTTLEIARAMGGNQNEQIYLDI